MRASDKKRLIEEAEELRNLLARAGCTLYGFDSPDSATGIDAHGTHYTFSAPALHRIRELEAALREVMAR